ncbi:hypothetical protein [Flavobacterium aquidurense]|jgi:hypothetical protein|nr:hypothetical protein [Flavobacterium aquidurense]SHG00693.1 hypothetical protein SAMN05444481_101437 [Flavobacterium frigidimaris]
MKCNTLLLALLLFFSIQIFGQVYTEKIVGAKNQELKDSLA